MIACITFRSSVTWIDIGAVFFIEERRSYRGHTSNSPQLHHKSSNLTFCRTEDQSTSANPLWKDHLLVQKGQQALVLGK